MKREWKKVLLYPTLRVRKRRPRHIWRQRMGEKEPFSALLGFAHFFHKEMKKKRIKKRKGIIKNSAIFLGYAIIRSHLQKCQEKTSPHINVIYINDVIASGPGRKKLGRFGPNFAKVSLAAFIHWADKNLADENKTRSLQYTMLTRYTTTLLMDLTALEMEVELLFILITAF